MSNIDIQGVIDNISVRTNVYTPIIEAVVNSIQAIEKSKRLDGEITILLKRDKQEVLKFDDDSLPDITSAEIHDNGIGFDDENTESFDTLYGRLKSKEGGKGFGRFMFLKYFDKVNIKSVYKKNSELYAKSFDFGKKDKFVENLKFEKTTLEKDTKTTVYLNKITYGNLDKKVATIARKLLEKLLVYFIDDQYHCPKIIVKEDGKDPIVLNDLLAGNYPEIQQVGDNKFELLSNKNSEEFTIKVFKIYYPDGQKSKVCLTAHNREVTETSMYYFIPEFEENFYEELEKGSQKDYMIKVYVLGKYLDKNVSLERVEFDFPKKDKDAYYSLTQEQIEKEATINASKLDAFKDVLKSRKEKKKRRVIDYINKEAPWHKSYFNDLDLSSVPYNFDNERIEIELQRMKYHQETEAKKKLKSLLDDPSGDIADQASKMVSQLSKANISDLAHYIASRKYILDAFKKSLERKVDGKYSLENAVHDIIFPTKTDSDITSFDHHNLWMVDERLNFTEYISSDKPLNGGKTERVDLLIFNQRVAFRGDNEASNPITIFEFKRPQRDDFINSSTEENPVEQLIRYVNDIRAGKFKTPKGRDIIIGESTPFYGFVVCDLTKKVTDWLITEQDFTPMADGQGYFQWRTNIKLYIEVISWDKLLKDAEMRNKIFFKKLGLI